MTHAFSGDVSTPKWATSFDTDVTKAITQRDGKFLSDVVSTDAGRMSHPTLDHYLPLLYAGRRLRRQGPGHLPRHRLRPGLTLHALDSGGADDRAVVELEVRTLAMRETREGDPRLARLFESWPLVVVEEMYLDDAPAEMMPEETAQVAGAVLRRRVEFAAGRLCARRALARLGITGFPLRNGSRSGAALARWSCRLHHAHGRRSGWLLWRRRRPRRRRCSAWPGRRAGGDPRRTVRNYVLTGPEEQRLTIHAPARQATLAKVIFSAKECFYKAQYPLSGRFLGFEDVEIELDPGRGLFEARLTATAPSGLPLTVCRGRLHDLGPTRPDGRCRTDGLLESPSVGRPCVALPIFDQWLTSSAGGSAGRPSLHRQSLYRFENWKRARAPRWPYFLRSLARASRVR